MATSIAAVSAPAFSSLAASPAYSQSLPSRSLVRALPTRRSMAVRSNLDPLAGIKDAVKGTKVVITAEQIKESQGQGNEKKSAFGAEPVKGSTLGRPELERRPETGSTSFFNIMTFDGPGPETMNGRLAMLGCVWALAAELATGQRIVDQVKEPGSPGLFMLLSVTQIIIFASLVPLFQGESPDSRRNGPFTAKAERWNGRLAMVGFAGILLSEYFIQAPLFHF